VTVSVDPEPIWLPDPERLGQLEPSDNPDALRWFAAYQTRTSIA
jgi:hypothetical protein